MKDFLKYVNIFARRNGPTILTGVGIGGGVTTVLLAINATPKALILQEDFLIEKPRATKMEILIKMLPAYVPTIAIGAVSIACIIGAHNINMKRNAALLSLYSLTDKAFKEYQEKVVEQIGVKKEEKIRDNVAQGTLNANPVQTSEIIIIPKGEVLFFDSLSSRYFMSDMENIRKIQNDYNAELFREGYKTLNELYYLIGLEGTTMGERTGWTNEGGMLEILFSTKLATDGRPCIVLNYSNGPRYL